jgi:hypothetical protein
VWKTMCMADATPMFRHYFLSQLRWWLGAYLGESRQRLLVFGPYQLRQKSLSRVAWKHNILESVTEPKMTGSDKLTSVRKLLEEDDTLPFAKSTSYTLMQRLLAVNPCKPIVPRTLDEMTKTLG